jgi:hypothetical protein
VKIRGRFSFCDLTLTAGDHQSRSYHNQHDAHDRRNPLVIVRSDAHMRVAYADTVMFRMGEGHKKGKHPQHQHYHPNQHQSFQGMPPESEFPETDEPLRAHTMPIVAKWLQRKRKVLKKL